MEKIMRYVNGRGKIVEIPLSKLYQIENPKYITPLVTQLIAAEMGINLGKIDVDQLTEGIKVEMEHADVTGNDLETTVRIALAHLKEIPDYYTRLESMEETYKEEKRNG